MSERVLFEGILRYSAEDGKRRINGGVLPEQWDSLVTNTTGARATPYGFTHGYVRFIQGADGRIYIDQNLEVDSE